MAKQTIERLIDDLDGSTATETLAFAIDGVNYVIDVNDQHAGELRKKLAPYIDVARRVSGARLSVVRGGARSAGDKERNANIREWALSEGVELPSRGRIAKVVQEAFDAKDGDALREGLGLELVEEETKEEEKPKRRRRGIVAEFSAAE